MWGSAGREIRSIDADRVTIGTDATNGIAVEGIGVSRVHAVIERFGDMWCVRDLGSRNGTFVNGERVLVERALNTGDEILLGRLRIVFRGPPRAANKTQALAEPPSLTPRERDVLVALCRPLLNASAFTEPASIKAIAEDLVVSEAAVKQHLAHLYDKFGVLEDEERRRVRLANAAVTLGAVTLGDLQPRS
ncbi:MAG: FHA domain-containing protein [Actinomycetota bacterium]|nr:FHA domain-containing protein [Actinomycetota bacterium]